MVKEIKTEKEFKEIIKKEAVVDFWASWCMPCMMFAPVFEEISKKFKNISFGKVNVDENRNLAEKYDISSIPTLLIFKKSKLVKKLRGSLSEEELELELKSL